jgi:hypothetical protein
MAIYLLSDKTFVFFPSFLVPLSIKWEGLDFFVISGVSLLHLFPLEVTLKYGIYTYTLFRKHKLT